MDEKCELFTFSIWSSPILTNFDVSTRSTTKSKILVTDFYKTLYNYFGHIFSLTIVEYV